LNQSQNKETPPPSDSQLAIPKRLTIGGSNVQTQGLSLHCLPLKKNNQAAVLPVPTLLAFAEK